MSWTLPIFLKIKRLFVSILLNGFSKSEILGNKTIDILFQFYGLVSQNSL